MTNSSHVASRNYGVGSRLWPALDRYNEQVYVLPIAAMPWVFANSKDIRIGENTLKPRTADVSDIFCK